MNTTENNKLIAEFMKWDILNDMTYSKATKGKWVELDKLKFHSNWNWLMEVVEKIESLHESNNVLIGTNITYVQIHNKVSNEQETFKGVSNIKIQAVYNTCVEFIKWYNENSAKEK